MSPERGGAAQTAASSKMRISTTRLQTNGTNSGYGESQRNAAAWFSNHERKWRPDSELEIRVSLAGERGRGVEALVHRGADPLSPVPCEGFDADEVPSWEEPNRRILELVPASSIRMEETRWAWGNTGFRSGALRFWRGRRDREKPRSWPTCLPGRPEDSSQATSSESRWMCLCHSRGLSFKDAGSSHGGRGSRSRQDLLHPG